MNQTAFPKSLAETQGREGSRASSVPSGRNKAGEGERQGEAWRGETTRPARVGSPGDSWDIGPELGWQRESWGHTEVRGPVTGKGQARDRRLNSSPTEGCLQHQ